MYYVGRVQTQALPVRQIKLFNMISNCGKKHLFYCLCKTRKGVPELRGPALVCLSATDKKISVLVFLMGQNPKCLRRVLLPPPSAVLANIHSILAYDVPDTEDVGLPSKFRINVGPALQSIAGSMLVNRLRR